jgi:hypothetical protein
MRQLIGLMRAVARLALPASDQLDYLAGIGVGDLADELAMELDDYGEQVRVDLGLTQQELAKLREIDLVLTELSSTQDENLWRTKALHEDERWERVRRLAREFLYLQGQ